MTETSINYAKALYGLSVPGGGNLRNQEGF